MNSQRSQLIKVKSVFFLQFVRHGRLDLADTIFSSSFSSFSYSEEEIRSLKGPFWKCIIFKLISWCSFPLTSVCQNILLRKRILDYLLINFIFNYGSWYIFLQSLKIYFFIKVKKSKTYFSPVVISARRHLMRQL